MNKDKYVVTIHQPESFPWLGYFNKMYLADEYVILDIVQFEKNYFQNRNRLLDLNMKPFYITIPVNKGLVLIKDVKINDSEDWLNKIICRIRQNYKKTLFFKDMNEFICDSIYESYISSKGFLARYNIEMIKKLRKAFHINNKLTIASDILDTNKKSSELLLEICKNRGATCYLSGPSGRDYLNEKIFNDNNISVDYHSYSAPTYPQYNHPSSDYIPYMSCFDALFNIGMTETEKLIKG